MQLSYKPLLTTCMLFLAFNVFADSEIQLRDPTKYFFHQSFNDLKEEIEVARKNGNKGIFIMFNDHDCPWCAKMKSTVMSQKTIQEFYRKHFRVITIDTRGDNTMIDFSGKELVEKDFSFKIHRVRATPVFMFFDLSGKSIMRYTGATRNAKEFQWLGEYVTSKTYKTMRFSKYKRKRLTEEGK